MKTHLILLLASFLSAFSEASESPELNSYDSEYGVFIGELTDLADGDVSGRVYVINETALQLVNFTYNGKAPDLYFWLDRKDEPTTDGVKIPTFEYGITPLGEYDNQDRVLLLLPGLHKIKQFKTFSLFCYKYEHNFGSIAIPENLLVPNPQFLNRVLKGSRYSVGSGPVLMVDRRTIKVFAFTFDGDKAPDGYFFVGRGPNVTHNAGVKVPIRGRDTPELITAMNEKYRGGQDMVLDLPEEYDITHIDWLSIYCYKFRVDFGHVPVSNISLRIPPYVPQQKKFDELEGKVEGWPTAKLLGNENRRNFTFQLGLSGGKKGYQALAHARPAKYVWYVNGYLAEIYLKRGVAYTFIVEGGEDKSTNDFYNPLYISDDQFGGYQKLSKDEREQVKIFAGADPSQTAGRLCVWSSDEPVDETQFNSFIEFRKSLNLKCETEEKAAQFEFTPDENTPGTLYYQSYAAYNMGWKIHVVDDLPTDIEDIREEPYEYEQWVQLQKSDRSQHTASGSTLLLTLSYLLCIIRFM